MYVKIWYSLKPKTCSVCKKKNHELARCGDEDVLICEECLKGLSIGYKMILKQRKLSKKGIYQC